MYERPYQKLVAWQEAHKLCKWIYKLTSKFPSEEKFRLVNQMCKSASSAPTNVAEGNGRRSSKDKAHFFVIALSSLDELHYQSFLSYELQYISKAELEKTHDQIRRVHFLTTKLRSSFL